MTTAFNFSVLEEIRAFAKTLGFQQLGVTDTSLPLAKARLKEWLALCYHGEMAYMAKYGLDRADPAKIVPGTTRVIVVRMDYLPEDPQFQKVLGDPQKGFISRYAQHRDYHKLMRKRLQKLGEFIFEVASRVNLIPPLSASREAKGGRGDQINPAQSDDSTLFRPFVDSGPIMEKPLAVKAGLGWIGKNTMLIHPKAGSFFFLGTLLTNLDLPIDEPFTGNHCGSCTACISVCPTQAIVAPYVLDARRCISYFTIEYKGVIPIEFRKAIGNRIYGCDDCNLICPWNKFAKASAEISFQSQRGLLAPDLLTLFAWSEADFLRHTEGSPIRRIGYECWQRNIAVALGNALPSKEITAALEAQLPHASELVKEHIMWALEQRLNQNA